MSSETDSDYETYKRTSLTRSVEYDRLYKGGDNTLSSTPFATESEVSFFFSSGQFLICKHIEA